MEKGFYIMNAYGADMPPDEPALSWSELFGSAISGGTSQGTYFNDGGGFWDYCPECAFHINIDEVVVVGTFSSNISSYAPSNTSYSDLWNYTPSPSPWSYWDYGGGPTGSGGWTPAPAEDPIENPLPLDPSELVENQADLGAKLFIVNIKKVLQDVWCIYIGQISGEISQEAHAYDFFDYRNVGDNFDFTPEWQIYSFENSSYKFAFQANPDDEFDCVRKYFPGNPSGRENSDTNGIVTTDYYGNPISHPYGIRIYGATGNIATLYFSSKSTWGSWWDYMIARQSNGDCNY